MDTDTLVKLVTKRVLEFLDKENSLINQNKNFPISIDFIGNDVLLKNELSYKINICTDAEIKIVSSLDISSLVDSALGKATSLIRYILEGKTVYLIEEGIEYFNYIVPKPLYVIYSKYLDTLKTFGVKVIKRRDVLNILMDIAKEPQIKGVITEAKLKENKLRDTSLIVKEGSIFTPLAIDYVKYNGIRLIYK